MDLPAEQPRPVALMTADDLTASAAATTPPGRVRPPDDVADLVSLPCADEWGRSTGCAA